MNALKTLIKNRGGSEAASSVYRSWREKFVSRMLYGTVILGLVALIPSVLSESNPIMAMVYIGAYVLLLIVTFSKFPYWLRMGIFLAVMYGVGVGDLFSLGILGDSIFFFLLFTVLSSLFFSPTAGIVATGINLATLSVVGWLSLAGQIAFVNPAAVPVGVFEWFSAGITTFIASAVIVLGLRQLQIEIAEAQQRAANVAETLTNERNTLEQRVADRTKDLAIVAEVSTATATILETDRLLQEVVDITKERFNLYHAHIYLLDEAGDNLVLAAGAGEPGRQMKARRLSIPLNREHSLVARAARERKGVAVNDVTQTPDFLPNPLLPHTRSELAVPMSVGGKVIGVFDVQSDRVGRFTESDISIQTTLAAQVAISVQNVRSFEQAKSQAEFESMINAIGQKIQRSGTVADVLQVAIRELGQAVGAARVSVSLGARQSDGNEVSNN
jgi:GAF domain-containing protein